MRPKHFQHNQLAFYHYAWLAILDPSSPMPDWGDAVEKTVTRQVKELRMCDKPTCLEPYLAHLYLHFQELHNKNMEVHNKRKAHMHTVIDSDIKMKEEMKVKSESQNATWIGETSGNKLQDSKMVVNFKEWGTLLHNFGRNTL
ncbi:hypothetical protein R1flu_014429 [Riccia fluitans]|uniref:Uncharacterized protein n=1 Tax=Riccia fluitans TaxID=41844 RepID=A0ABD1YGB5_9MARC